MRNHISLRGRSHNQLHMYSVVRRQAAEAGDAHAMGHLGHMYASGVGVEASNATALEWFRQAAEKNQASALYGLGYMHLSGMGVPRDARKAFKYFTLAAEQVRLPAPEAASCCKPSRCTWRGECKCLGFAPGSISALHSGPACVTALARVLKLPSSEACQPQLSFCELRLANYSSC